MAGIPAQLAADQRGVDRIAAVMAGAVGHHGDQARVRSALGMQLIHKATDRLHHLAVIAFSITSYAVAGA